MVSESSADGLRGRETNRKPPRMIDKNESKNGQAESHPLAQIMKEHFRRVVREALYDVVDESFQQLCRTKQNTSVLDF